MTGYLAVPTSVFEETCLTWLAEFRAIGRPEGAGLEDEVDASDRKVLRYWIALSP